MIALKIYRTLGVRNVPAEWAVRGCLWIISDAFCNLPAVMVEQHYVQDDAFGGLLTQKFQRILAVLGH